MVVRSLTRTLSRPLSRQEIKVLKSMSLGLNLAGPNSWAGAWLFSNLMYHAAYPDRVVGTGDWTYEHGKIIASNQTDVFRIKLADDRSELPAGLYTVLNPDGLEIALGAYGVPASGWTTQTSSTFDLQHTGGTFCIYVKGSITNNNGNLAVIMPGQIAAWNSGNVWNKQLLDFYAQLKMPVVRMMDWNACSNTIESEWSDRVTPSYVMFYSNYAEMPVVPYELMCDFANRIGADPWICAPARATQTYLSQLASLVKSRLSGRRKLWLELGNEIWNYSDPWIEGGRWIEHLGHTRFTATASAANQNFVLANHGMTNGQSVRCFATIENRRKHATTLQGWKFRMGTELFVKTIDANTFELYEEVGLVTKYPIHSTMVNLLFVKSAEAGKTISMHGNYSVQCLSVWDVFDPVIGVGKYNRLLVGQSGNDNVLSTRLANTSARARASAISIAPYYYGIWFGAEVVASSGQVLPKIWASDTATIHIALYPANATPSVKDVLAGTGAINKQVSNYVYATTYTSLAAITGLVDGTEYKLFMVVVDGSYNWVTSVNVTPSVGGQTVYAELDYDTMAKINRLAILKSIVQVKANQVLAPELPLYCYEGGLHFHHSRPANLKTWLSNYQNSPQFADVTGRYIAELTMADVKNLCYFADSSDTSFGVANGYHDTADVRYQKLVSFKGGVDKKQFGTDITFQNVLAPTILSESAYPIQVCTLENSGYGYEILSGNDDGNFSLVGNVLQMTKGDGIDWFSPTTRTFKILASNGHLTKVFEVSVGLGNAWYEADALFAWSSITDVDGTQINPVIGNPLPLIEGVASVPANGLFPMSGARYGLTTALISAPTSTKPLLYLAVLDKAAHSATYKTIWRSGGSNFFAAYVNANVNTDFRANVYNGVNAYGKFTPSTPTGKQVYWIYYDPATGTVTTGMNQVTGEQAAASFAGKAIDRSLYIGGSASAGMLSAMKHGSFQVVNRTGMTLADAKAIVAKMQAHHGIA